MRKLSTSRVTGKRLQQRVLCSGLSPDSLTSHTDCMGLTKIDANIKNNLSLHGKNNYFSNNQLKIPYTYYIKKAVRLFPEQLRISCYRYNLTLMSIPPLQINRPPCETGTESSKDQIIPLLQLVLPFVQTQRDCCRSRVTVLVDIHHHFFFR